MLKMIIVLLLVSSVSICSGNNDGAYEFVNKLYQNYKSEDYIIDYTGKEAELIFSKELLSLLRKDNQSAPEGEVGYLDGDPICDCQDWGEIELNKIEIKTEKGKTYADVYFTNLGSKVNVKLYLIKEKNKWLIDDIELEKVKSLKKELKEYLNASK